MSAKVLVIVPYPVPLPPFSGGQRGIYFPLKHLCATDTVYSYTLKENHFDFVEKNYNEMSASRMRYVNIFMAFRLLNIIKKHSIDVVQFEHPYLAWLMLFLRIFLKVKISMQTHNIEHVRFKQLGKKWWRLFWLYEKLAFKCADVVYYKTKEDKALACATLNDCRENGTVIYYGVDLDTLPGEQYFVSAKKFVRESHGLSDEKVILFNGSLSYLPNELAVQQIIKEINPLLKNKVANYKILICGKGLKGELKEQIDKIKEIVYTGFVDDIDTYFQACDVFINPVVEGGGVKTKLIEALGFGKSSISYFSGSFGADALVTNGRLKVVADYDSEQFVEGIANALQYPIQDDNATFYTDYSWKRIAGNISKAQAALLND